MVRYLRELSTDGVDVEIALDVIDDEIRDRISASLDSWDAAGEAMGVAEELGIDLGDRLEQQIEEARVSGALDLLRQWRGGDASVARREDIEEILSVVDASDLSIDQLASENDEEYGEYGNPVQALHNLLALVDMHPYMVRTTPPAATKASIKDEIARLFARLAPTA